MHRFTFPQASSCESSPLRLVSLDLSPAPGSFYSYELDDFHLSATSSSTLEGCTATRNSGIGGADGYMCFTITTDAPFVLPDHASPDRLPSFVLLEFPAATSSLIARVAISRVDLAHARGTAERELESKSFEQLQADAGQRWEAALGVVKANMTSEQHQRMFYTALYHSMLFPSLLSEEDGTYRLQRDASPKGMTGLPFTLASVDEILPVRRVPQDQKMYSTFSLWDTYRSMHPLLNLIHPKVSSDFGLSLMQMARNWGMLPPWQLGQSPADMMEGDGGSIVLATMARDGLIDTEAAFALLNTTRWNSKSSTVKKVSALLEQARADQCVAKLAQRAHRDEDMHRFAQRADSVFQLWDQEHHVFKPVGTVLKKGDEDQIQFGGSFTEGTPLQYSWAAEWHLDKLVQLHGGRDKFTCALDSFFHTAKIRGTRADVTGNMHGFTQGNEPDFHVPYLYSLVGRPAKTQALVDTLVKGMFSSVASGLPGNDDMGAMSSWLVLSMLGVYPADVCGDGVSLGRPFVADAELQVKQGLLRIKVHDQSDENMYVERATWNGKDLDPGRGPSGGQPLTLPWSELHQGGLLTFWMTSSPPAGDVNCPEQH